MIVIMMLMRMIASWTMLMVMWLVVLFMVMPMIVLAIGSMLMVSFLMALFVIFMIVIAFLAMLVLMLAAGKVESRVGSGKREKKFLW